MGKNYLLGLIGYPLAHSLSPLLHRVALKETGLNGDYHLYPIRPDKNSSEKIKYLLEEMRNDRLSGINVTIPYKQSVIPFLDELSKVAINIQAVNVIYPKNGKIIGDNSDVKGFLVDLYRTFYSNHGMDNETKTMKNQLSALLLGAGGSARAVSFGLLEIGWKVIIAARRLEQAKELKKVLSQIDSNGSFRFEPSVIAIPLQKESIENTLEKVDLLVNTTPAGMYPDIQGIALPEGIKLPRKLFVYDLVYNPQETKLMRIARENGNKASNGLGMLIEQAALSFEIWTGVNAPRAAMKNYMENLYSSQNI